MKKTVITQIKYTALKIFKTKKNKVINKIDNNNFLDKKNLKKNFVVIKVKHANLNYKDFLMCKGHSGLIKRYPHTPGIDASGSIFFSKSNKFKKNDKVYIIAQPLGVNVNGSFSKFITVPDSWVTKLPKNLNSKEIMMIGTSGFTAIKAFNKSLRIILRHKKKPVLITGATGNVGIFLVFLLKSIGVSIEATTSRNENIIVLKKIGVTKIYSTKNFLKTSNFSLLNEKYSVIFENLGGPIISTCLKYLVKNGVLISIGNILGNESKINILPFILRETNILGLNSESLKKNERESINKILGSIKFKNQLLKKTKVINLKDVSKIMKLKNFNKKSLRYVVKI